jgi:hypothetical protein
VRVRTFLTDRVEYDNNHQPRFVRMVDEASTARDAARAARDAWIKQTTEAWRTPARDVAQPDLGSRPEEVMHRKPDDDGAPDPGDVAAVERRRLTERGAEAHRQRDAAWQQYKDRLSNAWRGRTDPSRASEIEREGERWRGGR